MSLLATQLIGFGAGGPPPFSLVSTAAAYPALGQQTTHSFGSLSTGTPDEYRHIVVVLLSYSTVGGSPTITGITLDGNAMTAVASTEIASSTSWYGRIFILSWPTGTTATFVGSASANT